MKIFYDSKETKANIFFDMNTIQAQFLKILRDISANGTVADAIRHNQMVTEYLEQCRLLGLLT